MGVATGGGGGRQIGVEVAAGGRSCVGAGVPNGVRVSCETVGVASSLDCGVAVSPSTFWSGVGLAFATSPLGCDTPISCETPTPSIAALKRTAVAPTSRPAIASRPRSRPVGSAGMLARPGFTFARRSSAAIDL